MALSRAYVLVLAWRWLGTSAGLSSDGAAQPSRVDGATSPSEGVAQVNCSGHLEASVFIRRHRKAGSSTISHVIDEYQKYVNKACPKADVQYGKNEFECLPSRCALPSETFTMTHFRDPLTRVVSEYWWHKGPGVTYNASTAGLWRQWIDDSSSIFSDRPIAHYQSDPYVKHLSGKCDRGCDLTIDSACRRYEVQHRTGPHPSRRRCRAFVPTHCKWCVRPASASPDSRLTPAPPSQHRHERAEHDGG